MLSLSTIWHIVWFARVGLSIALFLVIVRLHLYKRYPLFTVHSGWIAIAGVAVVAANYSRLVSGPQYFTAIVISNGVEAILAFAIIYQMLAQRLRHYPAVKDLGSIAFRVCTFALVAAVLALAWLAPGQGVGYLTSFYSVMQRSVRTLQCGQLVFLFLFCGYFRLAWRSRAFGIALGLGILASSSLAINAIQSQLVSGELHHYQYILRLANEFTYLMAVAVWLFYMLAPSQAPESPRGPMPPHDLETWNRELERLLEP